MTTVDPIVPLSDFLRQPAGQYVLAWEQRQLDAVVADIFGYHAMQLGLPELNALRENRMPLRFCASDRLLDAEQSKGHSQVAVVTHFEELPFASQSIDLVVMPHVLEFADEPHQVLREVDRVLVPEGQVVITGFNPASLWGARQSLCRIGASPYLPRAGQFIGLPRIKDWLKLLSFEVNRGRFGCYAPWVRTEKWLARWSFLEKVGDRWWPVLGSLYMLTAIKRVRGMRLVGAVRKRKPERNVVLSPAASRTLLRTGDSESVIVMGDDRPANDAAQGAIRGAARG
ncbi:MAG TPA: class I SAM-dependent methyltransferase [Burkholderiaceae bacterium]|jgi:SAM-dependent methyltransferase|nr:class I SAM-dependent methyltransferase [Burkholderiaceae bacterium]